MMNAASRGEIKISMDQEIPPIAPPKDTAQVKYLRVQNERLSRQHGRRGEKDDAGGDAPIPLPDGPHGSL